MKTEIVEKSLAGIYCLNLVSHEDELLFNYQFRPSTSLDPEEMNY